MKIFLPCMLALAAVLSLSSCTTRLLKMSVAGSKNVNLAEATSYTAAHNVLAEGTDRSHVILIFPIGTPNIDHALEDALESAGPNAVALYNMTLDRTNWYIPFLYGQSIYTVKGDPVFREATPAPAAATPAETEATPDAGTPAAESAPAEEQPAA